MVEYKLHDVVNIFPGMETCQFRMLREDIEKNGLREPIWLDEKGEKIIDGRHRYMACKEIGVEPKFQRWSGEGDLLEFVVSLNLRRRHLKPAQKALAAAKSLPYFKEKAKERQLAGVAAGEDAGKAAVKVADVFGVSSRMVERAEAVTKNASQNLLGAVDDNFCSLENAVLIAKHYSHEEQNGFVKEGKQALIAAARSKKPLKKLRKMNYADVSCKIFATLDGVSTDDVECIIRELQEFVEVAKQAEPEAEDKTLLASI